MFEVRKSETKLKVERRRSRDHEQQKSLNCIESVNFQLRIDFTLNFISITELTWRNFNFNCFSCCTFSIVPEDRTIHSKFCSSKRTFCSTTRAASSKIPTRSILHTILSSSEVEVEVSVRMKIERDFSHPTGSDSFTSFAVDFIAFSCCFSCRLRDGEQIE